ncbi:MAG: hypothetical protein AAF467_19810 [Actinomycetota bacterium]
MTRRQIPDSLLQRWLAGDPDVELDIEFDMATLDQFTDELDAMDAEDDDQLSDALALALAPPGDLSQRLVAGVEARLSSRAVFGIVADVFGAGLQTSRLLLFEDANDDN